MESKPCSIELPGQPMDCCISSTAPLLATGLVDGQILLHRYHQAAAAGAAAAGENADVPSKSSSRYSASQVLARPSKKGASCRAVAFSEDGTVLLAGFETGTILQLDVGSGKVLARMTKAHSAGINRLLSLTEGQQQQQQQQQGGSRLFAAGDEAGGLKVWDLRSQQPVYQYSKHTDYISGLTQHNSSSSSRQPANALLAVSGDGTLSVHDLRAWKLVARSESDADDELLSVAVCKRGKKVVCGSQSGVLGLWSWGYWADCSDRFPGHPESVDALVTFDDDTLISGSSDGLLRVLNILPNKLIGVLGCHADDLPVERLALAPDRGVLVSTSHDSVVKLWDLGVLQEEEGEEGGEGSSSDWEEASSEEAAGLHAAAEGEEGGGEEEVQQQPDRTEAAAAAEAAGQQKQKQQQQQQQKGKKAAGAAAAAAEGASDDSDDSDSDSEGGGSSSRKRKRVREKTAMRKGGGKPKPSGNFFADLL